jgi:4-hydroxy-tetrahydrodipicolinate reductase
MNIAIIGYGKMGKQVEETAMAQGQKITAVIDPFTPEKNARSGIPIEKNVEKSENLMGADAAIEFTKPETALENIKAVAERKIPLVVGTTGWYDQLDSARTFVKKNDSALVYAANFSLGVNLFYRIAAYAARLLDPFPEYDAGGYEIHHNKKADSPSGTAKTLVDRVLAEMKRKKTPVWNKLDRQPAPEELHFASLRLGSDFGTHGFILDSPSDTIEIVHKARSRSGFALGAIRAAQWLVDSGRKGVFTIDDVLEYL